MNARGSRRFAPLLALLLIAAFYVGTVKSGHSWGGDFALYISHARNLLEGRPYSDTGYLYNPDQPFVSPRAYPPVFPIILVPLYAGFGLNLYPMKLACIAFAILAFALSFRHASRHLGERTSLLALALVGLNPLCWNLRNFVLSDFPFLCFSLGSLATLSSITTSPSPRGPRSGLACGALVALAIGTRSIGLVFVPVLLYAALRYELQRRCLVWAIGLVGAASFLLSRVATGTSDYLAVLQLYGLGPQVLASILKANATALRSALLEFWQCHSWPWLSLPLALVFSTAAIYQWAVAFRARRSPYELFVPIYLIAAIFWPLGQDPRFFLPILPLYVVYGLEFISGQRPTRLARAGIGVVVVSAALLYARFYTDAIPGPLTQSVESSNAKAAFQYISDQTAANNVILASRPREIALYARRPALAAYTASSDSVLLGRLAEDNVTHVFLSRWYWDESLRRFLERNPGTFAIAYRNPEYMVFAIKPTAP